MELDSIAHKRPEEACHRYCRRKAFQEFSWTSLCVSRDSRSLLWPKHFNLNELFPWLLLFIIAQIAILPASCGSLGDPSARSVYYPFKT